MLKNMQEVLEYGFEVFNKVYFNNELPPIIISIMSSPRTNGHFTCGKVWRAEETLMHEINISAEHLDRPIENIMATLQHEMIHYYCQLNGISDTSQYGRYHNKNFKKEAEANSILIEVYTVLAEQEMKKREQRQAEGIKTAKDRGVRFGRTPIEVNELRFKEIYKAWKDGRITARKAMEILELKPNTFYRRVQEFENKKKM